MRPHYLRLLKTLPHNCGYYDDRTATNVVLDPASQNMRADYAQALQLGFRRAGSHVYRPQCQNCRACVPCRLEVGAFRPDRRQRRCLKLNADLQMYEMAPGFSQERHDLYSKYLHRRHPDGGMDPGSPKDFDSFLQADWSPTVFLEFRLQDRLLAVAVTDICSSGASAVYTFFDPDEAKRGLGTYAILRQIELTLQRQLDYLYLGYWIAGHPKMDYKAQFQPMQFLGSNGWRGKNEVGAEQKPSD